MDSGPIPRESCAAATPDKPLALDGADGTLALLIYEVGNTFGEIHPYVLPVRAGEVSAAGVRQEQDKLFYERPDIAIGNANAAWRTAKAALIFHERQPTAGARSGPVAAGEPGPHERQRTQSHSG